METKITTHETNTGNGWQCESCRAWVIDGQAHACIPSQPQNYETCPGCGVMIFGTGGHACPKDNITYTPYVPPAFPSTLDYMMLERIAIALEGILKELKKDEKSK